MKYIIKQYDAPLFAQWKALENDDWKPSYNDLSNPEKKELKASLLKEQGYLCCYCNCRINDEQSHIEHFKPQCDYEALALDYNNLHASCLKEQSKDSPKHCGVAKENWFEDGITISPLNTDCEQVFRYIDDGHVYPKNTENHSQIFINKLNLNDSLLIKKRREAIAGWLSEDFILEATHQEIDKLNRYLENKHNDKYEPFSIAIKQQLISLIL